MTYLRKLQADRKYGETKEEEVHALINTYFGIDSERTGKWTHFDYIDKIKNIIVELKSRRYRKDKFYDTMIGMNKINYFKRKINDGYKVILCFNFIDGLYYYPFDGSVDDNWVRDFECWTRGRREAKKHFFIPCSLLKKVEHATSPEDTRTQEVTEGVSNPLQSVPEETQIVEE